MTTRAAAILLAAAVLGGAGVDSSGERVIRLAAGADRPSAAADLGHPEKDTVNRLRGRHSAIGAGFLARLHDGAQRCGGDVDADGLPDLFFGTFTNRRPKAYLCEEGRGRTVCCATPGTARGPMPEPASSSTRARAERCSPTSTMMKIWTLS